MSEQVKLHSRVLLIVMYCAVSGLHIIKYISKFLKCVVELITTMQNS